MLLHPSMLPWTLKPRVLIRFRVDPTVPAITPVLTGILLGIPKCWRKVLMRLDPNSCTRLLLSERQNWALFGLFRWLDCLCNRPLTCCDLRCLALSMQSLLRLMILVRLVVMVLRVRRSVLGYVVLHFLGLLIGLRLWCVNLRVVTNLGPLFNTTLAL